MTCKVTLNLTKILHFHNVSIHRGFYKNQISPENKRGKREKTVRLRNQDEVL